MSAVRLPRLLFAALAGAAAIAAGGAAVSAHPTALTDVQITINRNGTFEVTLTTLAEPLVGKLEALAGVRPAGRLSPAATQGRIVELQKTLASQMDIRFGDIEVTPDLDGIDALPDQKEKIAIYLSGLIPAGGSTLTWSTGLIYGSYPLAVRHEGARTAPADDALEWLTGAERSRVYEVAGPTTVRRAGQMWRAVTTGFTHILPKGLDHILFVLGLFLLAARTRAVLLQVTTFTVAHSITLGLSLYGIVSLPSGIVEPLIALSIVYVALENFFTSALTPWRLALVFAFGLLHGLGFAEALAVLDLPRAEFFRTLVAFNLGVEAGQLAVILAAALAVFVLRIPAADYRRLVVRPASAAIGLAGIFWMAQRLV